jgi:hypothetical protein
MTIVNPAGGSEVARVSCCYLTVAVTLPSRPVLLLMLPVLHMLGVMVSIKNNLHGLIDPIQRHPAPRLTRPR